MKWAFWISVAFIFYTYVGYPVLIWLLAKLRPKPWKREFIQPSVSILMPVRNAVGLLPSKLEHLFTLDYPNVKEIIVVSDGSTDGTAELLNQCGDPRLKKVILAEHSGKAVALNEGLKLATGEIVLFVDIRPRIAAGAVQELVSSFADPSVGCVAGELLVGTDGHEASAAAVGGLYWRYEQWIRNSESAFDSPVGVYGGFYAARRALLTPFPPGIILDDMFQPLAIIRQGYRSVVDTDAVVHDVWPKTMAGEFQRKVRTLAGNYELIRISPWLVSPINRVVLQFFSHKLLRLVVPYLAIIAFATSVLLARASSLFLTIAALQGAVFGLTLIGVTATIKPISKTTAPFAALIGLNAAAVFGLYRFLFAEGPLWKIWVTPEPQGKVGTVVDIEASRAIYTHPSPSTVAGTNSPSRPV